MGHPVGNYKNVMFCLYIYISIQIRETKMTIDSKLGVPSDETDVSGSTLVHKMQTK